MSKTPWRFVLRELDDTGGNQLFRFEADAKFRQSIWLEDGLECEVVAVFDEKVIDAMQADIDRLRKDAITALADGGVLIRLPRVEGYEDVCDELLAADALEGINWPSYELLTAEETKGTT